MGPAGDSSVLATDGKRALALLKFRLAAFHVILSTPYGKISAMLPSLLLSRALYCTLDSPPLPAPTPVIRIEAGRLLNPAPLAYSFVTRDTWAPESHSTVHSPPLIS
jgi:hypothetical protein